MRLGTLGLIGYVLFLAGYSVYKYSVAAPPEFSTQYAISVAILVAMTGVAPFLVALGLVKGLSAKGFAGSAIGLITGLVACVGAYAAFWALFIQPTDAEIAMTAIATRGIGWGLLQGGLASIIANH
jgi:hypothetical protein